MLCKEMTIISSDNLTGHADSVRAKCPLECMLAILYSNPDDCVVTCMSVTRRV
jgi:hypothetical protein